MGIDIGIIQMDDSITDVPLQGNINVKNKKLN